MDLIGEMEGGTEKVAQKIGEGTSMTGVTIDPMFLKVAAIGAILFAGSLVAGFAKGAYDKMQ